MSLVDPTDHVEVTAENQNQETQANAQPESQNEADIPEKFRGKSFKEVVSSYQNLESEVGRHRNEIGTLRRLTDELLDLRRGSVQAKSQTEAKPVTPHDLAERPNEVITEVAKRVADESLAEERAARQRLENDLNAERFEKKYPGFQNTINSSDFAQWVQKSQVRVGLAMKAARGDWSAASELLDLHNEFQSVNRQSATETKQPTEDAKQASLAKSGGSGANKVVNGSDGKKIYKRSELAELFVRAPEEYNRRYANEFAPAYEEGRVR